MASPLGLAMMLPGANAPGQLQPTNVTGAYALSQDAAEKNYQAKLAQQNAMWGGMAGLGSAGIMAAPKLLGAGGPFAAGGAFSPYATAADAGAAGGIGTGGFNAIDAAAPAVASGATDALAAAAPAAATDAFAAGAPVAADLAATAAPAAVDAGAMSIADLLALLPMMFA